MAESFEGLLKKVWHMDELKSLTSQIREHESLLRLKRRWLMDLPLSIGEQKRIEEILPPNDKILPESFLREDDVSYNDVRTCIEMAFGVHNCRKEPYPFNEDVKIPNSRDVLQEVFLLLDALTNKGLCSLVKILNGGVTKFEKTNWSMKRLIKELLPEVVADKNDISKTKLKQLFRLLQDPSSYCGNQITAPMAYNAAVVKVLDGLGDFPSRALIAMHRKLKGVRGYIPSFRPPKNGEERDNLIRRVKKKCMKMLSDTSGPSERLAGALGVAALTSKLMMNHPAMREFERFSPEIKALQNDILKAIHLINEAKKVSLIELRKVQILLDPDSELSVRSLRMAVRNLLTEYLYECSDMDTVPDFLIETLDIINRRSQLPSLKKGSSSEVHSSPLKLMEVMMEKEVECVLSISAQAKEVVSNLLPDHEFDEEFARAYTEDYDIDDTHCVSDDDDEHFQFRSDNDSSAQEESVGETNPGEVNSPIGRLNMTNSGSPKTEVSFHSTFCDELNILESQKQYLSREPKIASSNSVKRSASYQSHSPARNSCYNDLKIEEKEIFSDLPQEEQEILSHRSRPVNEYLEVQEACDVTSVIAYRFVGLVLDKLAKSEGLELYQGDRLYLHSHASVRDDSEEYERTLLLSKFSEMWKELIHQQEFCG